MKLSEYAKQKGISYLTAYRWFKAGNLQAEQMPSGTIIVNYSGPFRQGTKIRF